MAKYQVGNFTSFSKAERVMLMQMHARKIQASLSSREITDFFAANDEIQDLSTKSERAKSSDAFNISEYQAFLKKFKNDESYREDVLSRIDTPIPSKYKKK